MNNPQIPDLATRTRAIENLRKTRREIAEFNQELAEIEAEIDRELYAQKLARFGKSTPISSDISHNRPYKSID